MYKSLVSIVFGAALLGGLITMAGPAGASVNAPSVVAAATSIAPAFKMNPTTDRCRRAPASTHAQLQCVHMARGLLRPLTAAQQAQRNRSLTRHLPVSAARAHPGAAGTTVAPAQTTAAPTQCNFTALGGDGTGYLPHPDRFTSCSDTEWTVTEYLVVGGTERVIGILEGEDFQWTSYRQTASTWSHGMIINTYLGQEAFELGVPAEVISNCVGANTCAAAPIDPYAVFLAPGGSDAFDWTEYDLGPAASGLGQVPGSIDTLDRVLGADVTYDLLLGTLTSHDVGQLAGRCDSAMIIGASTSGCVDEAYIPTLKLSLAQYGAAAALVFVAQDGMNAHWGLKGYGNPLTRFAGGTNNRNVICYDGTFINQGAAIGGNDGDSDSCDEFPFAGTNQSGALNGVTSGAQCQQLTSVPSGSTTGNVAADWPNITTDPPGSAFDPNLACVRGHVPLTLNRTEGTAYSAFIRSVRLLNDDQFWVSVTT
jgi:hypothetical protein